MNPKRELTNKPKPVKVGCPVEKYCVNMKF
jgi:hypothetical protein